MNEPEEKKAAKAPEESPLLCLRLISRGLPLLLVVVVLVTLMIERNKIFPVNNYPDNPPEVQTIGFAPEKTEPVKDATHTVKPQPATTTKTVKPVATSSPAAANPKTNNTTAVANNTTTANTYSPAPKSNTTTPVTQQNPVQPSTIDWSKTKITGPIDGSYIVIFLTRRIVALVKDQQYVRAYYYAKIPADISAPKTARNDKRAPQGDYYIAKHELEGKVMTLILSYPSPVDAQKALASGLISKQQNQSINLAFTNKILPPQTTALGGPVRIRGAGSANTADPTSSGSNISIAPGQMEELWLATRKGTVVRIVK